MTALALAATVALTAADAEPAMVWELTLIPGMGIAHAEIESKSGATLTVYCDTTEGTVTTTLDWGETLGVVYDEIVIRFRGAGSYWRLDRSRTVATYTGDALDPVRAVQGGVTFVTANGNFSAKFQSKKTNDVISQFVAFCQ